MSFMDELERRRFLNTLRSDEEFRSTVRREILAEELLNLPQTVATLVDVVAQQRHDFAALATSTRDYMERTITLIGDGFTAVRSEISGLGTDMGSLRTDMGSLRTEVGSLGTEVGSLRTEVGSLRTEVGSLRTEMGALRTDMESGFTAVRAEFDQVHAEIRVIKDQLAS